MNNRERNFAPSGIFEELGGSKPRNLSPEVGFALVMGVCLAGALVTMKIAFKAGNPGPRRDSSVQGHDGKRHTGP